MIQKIEADHRYFSNIGWLQSHWLFSFSNYYDPANVHFGALRVFNDDIIQPNTGFDTHPHKEMEIVSIVFEGQLNHQDSMGNKSVIKKGEVQRMTAGTGIMHSEHNYGDVPTSLFQLWIHPSEAGLEPSYDQKDFTSVSKTNILLPVVSGQSMGDGLHIHSDSTVYLSELQTGNEITFTCDDNRNIFVYVIDGNLKINNEEFKTRDQARISMENKIIFTGMDTTSFILIDVQDMPEIH